MPPANSPSETPGMSSSTTPPYLQQLELISSPVPNLAATLITPPEIDDANDENVSFLRTRHRSPPDSSSSSRARRRRLNLLPEIDIDSMDAEEPRLPRAPVEASGRFPIVRRQRDGPNIVPNYEGRMSNVRSLYGWAPGSEDDENDDQRRLDPMHDSNADHIWFGNGSGREANRGAATPRISRREGSGRTPPPHTSDSSESNRPSGRNWTDSNSVTEALLRSVRRNPRFAGARSRAFQNSIVDRERSGGQESGERDRERERTGLSSSLTTRTLRLGSLASNNRIESSRSNLSSGESRQRVNAHRPVLRENPPSARLKEAMKYLERIRFSNSDEESISSAAEGGFVRYEYFTEASNAEDFILDTLSIAPPAECSWLRPGAVFSGSQRAANSVSLQMLAHRISNTPQSSEPVIVNGSDTSRIAVSTSSGGRYWANNLDHSLSNREHKDERWPVKVTIHSIDYSTMTLSGTMEAYNIPDKTSPTRDAHIITFLEGEIIDLNAHTLVTKNFTADADIDSTYWRELQPFKNLSDDEMIKNLLNRRWMTEELSQKWILMRWKERCFITPTDARQGLTISGFYYISLRRDTGEVEGLYYDPGSSPYQQLSLKPDKPKMVFPAYDFR